jgi:hypothetical protein
MAHFSDYMESGLMNWLLRANSNTFARPSTIALALCSTPPLESQNGSNIPELPNANGYARYTITQNNSNWTEVSQVAGSGFLENGAEYLFTQITANVGHASGWAIVDSATYGAGNVLMCGQFPNPRVIEAGDAPVIRAGALDIYLG